jgi:arginase
VTRTVGLIGVPSSAGAHWPGQEKAPRALREAGLVERLESSGLAVSDYGDLSRTRFRPDPERRNPQNLEAVAEVVRAVADRVEVTLRAGETPLVIGGDCTIELGVLLGFLRAGRDPALLYFDGGVDLRTPETNPTGILDSMGVAHMVGEPGAADELARIGPRFPLMEDERIVLLATSRITLRSRCSSDARCPATRPRSSERGQGRQPPMHSPGSERKRNGSWCTSTWT